MVGGARVSLMGPPGVLEGPLEGPLDSCLSFPHLVCLQGMCIMAGHGASTQQLLLLKGWFEKAGKLVRASRLLAARPWTVPPTTEPAPPALQTFPTAATCLAATPSCCPGWRPG